LNNGIIEEQGHQHATDPKFLIFSKFDKYLNWNNDELDFLYTKLKNSYAQLSKSKFFNNNNENIFSLLKYDSLLDEMFKFLTKNEKVLNVNSDYLSIRDLISDNLKQKRGFSDVNEALISDDSSIVIDGMNQLYQQIISSDIETYLSSVYLIIDRVLFKRSEGFVECLDYIAFYLEEYFTKKEIPLEMLQKLLLMFKLYKKNTIQELDVDVPKATKYLVKISGVLKKHNIHSENIDYWESLRKSKRFNLNLN
jgi:hypothetical protein